MVSKRLELATNFISHFTALDTEILEDILAESYTHHYAPSSIPSQGPFDKKGLINFVSGLKTIMARYPMSIRQSLESESSNAVTLWVTGQASFHEEVKDDSISKEDWEYTGEYIFLLYMDEAQKKIIKTIEFLDSKATADKLSRLAARAMENRSRAQKE